jgi:hypothetical protein
LSAFPIANVFAEIRALTRDGEVPAHLISRLQHRLEDVEDVLQGSTIVAMGLLASARGERRHARELMESVRWLDARAVPAATAECALGWLVTDAAAEGQWSRVRSLIAEFRAVDTAAMRFFAQLARRVLEGEAVSIPGDDWYQLPSEARRFFETFTPKPTATFEVPAQQPVLLQLLNLREETAPGPVASAVASWLKSPRLRDQLMERGTLLGGASPDDALLELRAVCEGVLENRLTKREDEPWLHELATRRRAALIEELDARLDRLTDACEDGTAPPMTEVWREFVAIRKRYSLAVALSEPAERGWPHHVVLRLTRYFGTWLRLTKEELPFAHAVFRFLEAEATAAGDETSARLAKASAALCLPFAL